MKRPEDKKFHTIIKVLMSAVFAWSGFFWSGVTALQFFINDQSNAHLSSMFLAGSIVLLIALLLAWARLYILQFIVCLVGLAVYLRPAREMIDHAADTGVLFKPTFEQRYLPMVGFAILAMVLFILRVSSIISKKLEQREEFNNRPTESILDKKSED